MSPSLRPPRAESRDETRRDRDSVGCSSIRQTPSRRSHASQPTLELLRRSNPIERGRAGLEPTQADDWARPQSRRTNPPNPAWLCAEQSQSGIEERAASVQTKPPMGFGSVSLAMDREGEGSERRNAPTEPNDRSRLSAQSPIPEPPTIRPTEPNGGRRRRASDRTKPNPK